MTGFVIDNSTQEIRVGSGGIKIDPGATDLLTVQNGVLLPDGSLLEPALRFADDTNTGIYSPSQETISICGNGQDIVVVDGNDKSVTISGLKYPTADGVGFLSVDNTGAVSIVDAPGSGPDYINIASSTTTPPIIGGTNSLAIGYNIDTGTSYSNIVIGTQTDSTYNVVKGSRNIIIGDNAIDNDTTNNNIFVAVNAGSLGGTVRLGGSNNVVVGKKIDCRGSNCISIGNPQNQGFGGAFTTYNTMIGGSNKISNVSYSTVIGDYSTSAGLGGIAIGHYAVAQGSYSIFMGYSTSTNGYAYSGNYSITVGYGAYSRGDNSVVIGPNSYSTHSDAVILGKSIGSSTNGQIKIGNSSNYIDCRDGKLSTSGTSAMFVLPTYTVATLPTGTTGAMIYVSDASGGGVPAFYNGTNWCRSTDATIIS